MNLFSIKSLSIIPLLSIPLLADACDLTVNNSSELKAAISASSNSGKEICLEKGVYLPDPSDRNASFNVSISNVTLKGLGNASSVVLSGNIGDPNVNTDNSYHVVTVVNQSGIIFKNLTISDGYSELNRVNSTGAGWGAGLYTSNVDLSLKNIIIQNNQLTALRGRGAGLGATSSRVVAENSSFQNNQAGNAGGGFFAQNTGNGPSTTEIYNSEFISNSTLGDPNNSTGGGFGALISESVIIKNTNFEKNKTTSGGGAVWTQNVNLLSVDNSTFSDNSLTVFGTGGALYLAALDSQSISIKNSTFSNNNAEGLGGAITLAYAPPESKNTIENSQFLNNKSTLVGGAIWTLSPITISNSKFVGNSADYGGAIVDGTWPVGDPTIASGAVTLVNTIFNQNTASQAGGGQHFNCFAPVGLPGEIQGSVLLQNTKFKNPEEPPVNCGL